MKDVKTRSTPLGNHWTLSKKLSPKKEEEKEVMTEDPYGSTVSNLMYTMVCTIPDITHVVGFVSHFMSNLGKEH